MESRLTYSRVSAKDADELLAMRKACGWGEDRIPRILVGTDMIIYIFYLPSEEGSSSSYPEPVAMGGFELVDVHHGGDLALCDPLTGTIMISSLFVYQKFEGQGFGNAMMDILEGPIARELGGKIITLTVHPEDFEESGKVSKQLAWYLRRGYSEFRERRPWFPWDQAEGGFITGCFLSKKVLSVASS